MNFDINYLYFRCTFLTFFVTHLNFFNLLLLCLRLLHLLLLLQTHLIHATWFFFWKVGKIDEFSIFWSNFEKMDEIGMILMVLILNEKRFIILRSTCLLLLLHSSLGLLLLLLLHSHHLHLLRCHLFFWSWRKLSIKFFIN